MFIAIDGPDGVGKTTVARKLVQRLKEAGKGAVYTAEPTQLHTGREIRRILQQGTPAEQAGLAELFIEDRRQHLRYEIAPRLAKGVFVVCDRYKYSTISYQQLQGDNDVEELVRMNSEFRVPDFAFIINAASADVLLGRIEHRAAEKEIFEDRDTQEAVMQIYREMKTAYFPDENIIEILVGEKDTPDDVVDVLWQHIFADPPA